MPKSASLMYSSTRLLSSEFHSDIREVTKEKGSPFGGPFSLVLSNTKGESLGSKATATRRSYLRAWLAVASSQPDIPLGITK